MGEELRNLYSLNVTNISNEFLEKYLADVNPEFLKVYLYYLWKGKENLSLEDVANELNLTINDVERAVKYWAKQKRLNSINKNEKTKSSNKDIEEDSIESSEDNIANKDYVYTIEADFLKKQKKKFKTDDKEYKELLLYAERMLPNISNLQVNLFRQLYYDDGMALNVIEYLIEYCAELGKVNTKYMKTVATSWLENGYKTVEEVKDSEEQFHKDKTKKSKTPKKKTVTLANKRETDYYEKMFLEKSAKKGSN